MRRSIRETVVDRFHHHPSSAQRDGEISITTGEETCGTADNVCAHWPNGERAELRRLRADRADVVSQRDGLTGRLPGSQPPTG